jgi:hypothetical protein
VKTLLYPSSTYSLQEAIGQYNVVCINVGPDGKIYLVLVLKTLDYRTECNGFTTFVKVISSSPQLYRVLIVSDGNIELDLTIEHEQFNIHDIQPLGNNLLLTCCRSHYRGPDID